MMTAFAQFFITVCGLAGLSYFVAVFYYLVISKDIEEEDK